VGGIGGLIVFLGIVLWFTAYLNARQMDRGLSAIGKARQPYAARHWCREPIRYLKIENLARLWVSESRRSDRTKYDHGEFCHLDAIRRDG